MSYRLSKSRFVAGWQCPRFLWWKVHEPEAAELELDIVARDRIEQGNEVGFLAQQRYPGGVLVDRPYDDMEGKLRDTRAALDEGAPAIFEAAFYEDDVFVAVDVLERVGDAFRLIEVKSTTSVHDKHVVDAAIQTHVARRAGLDVREVVLMHVDRDYRHPDVGDLFVQEDVTAAVEDFLPGVPGMIRDQLALLAGPDPGPCIGEHCAAAEDCPFKERCWPQAPDHVRRLHRVGLAKAFRLMEQGIHTFGDVQADTPLGAPARRQLEAWRTGRMVVEPGLADALAPFRGRVGFLDFESVARVIPVWAGVAPWGIVPVQFSYHERAPDGSLSHTAWLAEGPEDPRPGLARALVDATRRADVVATYSGYEHRCIGVLEEAVPELAAELARLDDRLRDLLPVVRDHIAHPDFGGSFSIKDVLGPLAGDLSYDGLEVSDGQVASVELARLLLRGDRMTPEERDAKRAALLQYCHMDTYAMVRLLERLEELAGVRG